MVEIMEILEINIKDMIIAMGLLMDLLFGNLVIKPHQDIYQLK